MIVMMKSSGFVIFLLSELIGILLIVLLSMWLIAYHGGMSWQSNPKFQFNWHPVLMTLGMVFFYGHAILVYRVLKIQRDLTKLVHAFLNLSGLLLATVGLKAVFDYHSFNVNLETGKAEPIPNLYSLHSWLGLSAVVLFAAQWACGFLAFLFPKFGKSFRASYLPVHVWFGLFLFVLCSLSALLGLTEKTLWSVRNYSLFTAEGILVNTIGVLIVVYGALVAFIATNNVKVRPSKHPSENRCIGKHD